MDRPTSRSVVERSYYSGSIADFSSADVDGILGRMAQRHDFDLTPAQRDAWVEQVPLLQEALRPHRGAIYLEFSIPRMGTRADVVVLIGPLVFVLEFKVGEDTFHRADLDQVIDYALDLQNFHEGSHEAWIAPVLVCTKARALRHSTPSERPESRLFPVAKTDGVALGKVIREVLALVKDVEVPVEQWERSPYKPTPTIIEATLAAYRSHTVEEITRNDAKAVNLTRTSGAVADIIRDARANRRKVVCFVTGVPGAGKTLVGLDTAARHTSRDDKLRSVFLSGNAPLVKVLREALVRDESKRKGIPKTKAFENVKALIQNVHHFRDDCLADRDRPPQEHVAIFDEAQRAWDLAKIADFMKRKKKISGFQHSEPEFLLSCLDRHRDWAAVVCLVGGGQEIHTGEAGIREWLDAMRRSFPHWAVYLPERLTDKEYAAEEEIAALQERGQLTLRPDLHLASSMRSFRSERVSDFVKCLLDLDVDRARESLQQVTRRYPIVLTRDLQRARRWVKSKARGSERYGMMVSSKAERLKPHAVDIRAPIDPVHWFLNGKEDVRSSYYLEDVATEFHVQGLELDWSCVVWDADFRHSPRGWDSWAFRGDRWEKIKIEARKAYQKNAYRVLLTRARQGMVVVVPEGDPEDATRAPSFYDDTFKYLKACGLETV